MTFVKVCFLMIVVGVAACICSAQLVEKSMLDPSRRGFPEEKIWKEEINVGAEITYKAKIRVTSKGNGSLIVNKQNLGRVYDRHDDGRVFQNGLAEVVFKDINNDGFKDFVISGIVVVRSEKGPEVLERRAFVRIMRFDPKNKNFVTAYDSKNGDGSRKLSR